MTDFGTLLPPRRPVPTIPARGGPAAVRAAAEERRRRSATRLVAMGSAACFTAGVLLAVPGPTRDVGIVTPPVPPGTTSSVTVPVPSAGETGTATGTPGATASAGPAGPATVASNRPAVAATAPPSSAVAAPVPEASPVDPAAHRYTRIDRVTVADRQGEPCEMKTSEHDPGGALCARYLGPATAKVGRPVDLEFEYCAPAVDVTLQFPEEREIAFTLAAGTGDVRWTGIPPPGGAAHEVVIERETCLRYVAHWSGRLTDGTLPQAREYEVDTWLQDGVERMWMNRYFSLTLTP